MARYNIVDRPQTAQAVNVGQFGPSYDSLQDWRSVFTAAAEVAEVRNVVIQIGDDLVRIKETVDQTLADAQTAVNIASEIAKDTREYVIQAAADIAVVEANVVQLSQEVTINTATSQAAAAEATASKIQAEASLVAVKDIQDDMTNLTVSLETPDPGTEPSVEFNNTSNHMHLKIPRSAADFTGVENLPVFAGSPNDYIVGSKRSDNTVYRMTIGELTAHLATGVKIRGLWHPRTNLVELDPQNTHLTKNTAPTVAVGGSPEGAGYSIAEAGEFDLYGPAGMNSFKEGDFVQWSETSNSWIHQKIGNTVLSVNGRQGVVTLGASDVGAVNKKGDTIEGDFKIEGRLLDSSSNAILWRDPDNRSLVMGDLSSRTVLEGDTLFAHENNPAEPSAPLTGRIFHAGKPPTEDEVDMYTRGNTYGKTQLDSILSRIDGELNTKAPTGPVGSSIQYAWSGATNNWQPLSVTATQAGALPITGGQLTGKLYTPSLDVIQGSNGLYIGAYSDYVEIAPKVGGSTPNWSSSLRWYSQETGWLIGGTYKLYHEGNKPTAEDVGAFSKTESDIRNYVSLRGSFYHSGDLNSALKSGSYYVQGPGVANCPYQDASELVVHVASDRIVQILYSASAQTPKVYLRSKITPGNWYPWVAMSTGVGHQYLSTRNPTGSDGVDGDVWIKYI